MAPSLREASDEQKQKYLSRVPKSEVAGGFIWPGMVVTYEKILSLADMDLGENDFIIASYPKSGTTWSSEVVSAIAHVANLEILNSIRMEERVPWLELDFNALPEDSPARAMAVPQHSFAKKRVFFTHVHPQFLPKAILNGKCKMLYVARNPKDTAVSYFHFHHLAAFLKNEIDLSWDEYFPLFTSGNLCCGSWFKHAVNYWKLAQSHDNVKFVKFEDMKKDLVAAVKEICEFVGVPLTEEQRLAVVDHCSFKSMKENKMTNREDQQLFDGDGTTFMRKGIVGDWKNYFTVAQNEAFEDLYKRELEGSGLSFEFK